MSWQTKLSPKQVAQFAAHTRQPLPGRHPGSPFGHVGWYASSGEKSEMEKRQKSRYLGPLHKAETDATLVGNVPYGTQAPVPSLYLQIK